MCILFDLELDSLLIIVKNYVLVVAYIKKLEYIMDLENEILVN